LRQDFNFYPVERRSRDGPCVKIGAQIEDTGAFDLLLLALTPDQLQVRMPRFAFWILLVFHGRDQPTKTKYVGT
jgi:hypothetical protein